MAINPEMITLQGRILPSPRLAGGADMEGGNSFGPSSGKWDLRGYRLKTVFVYLFMKLMIAYYFETLGYTCS